MSAASRRSRASIWRRRRWRARGRRGRRRARDRRGDGLRNIRGCGRAYSGALSSLHGATAGRRLLRRSLLISWHRGSSLSLGRPFLRWTSGAVVWAKRRASIDDLVSNRNIVVGAVHEFPDRLADIKMRPALAGAAAAGAAFVLGMVHRAGIGDFRHDFWNTRFAVGGAGHLDLDAAGRHHRCTVWRTAVGVCRARCATPQALVAESVAGRDIPLGFAIELAAGKEALSAMVVVTRDTMLKR